MAGTVPTFISSEEYRLIRSQVSPERASGRRNRAILSVMWKAGLRVEEVCELTPHDLSQVGENLVIRVRGKGRRNSEGRLIKKQRLVSASPGLKQELLSWKDELESTDQVLFPVLQGKNKGQRLRQREVHETVTKASAAAGVFRVKGNGKRSPVWPHVLRHSFATNLVDGGMDLLRVRDLMGHDNVRTTQVYLHLAARATSEEMGQILDEGKNLDRSVDLRKAENQELQFLNAVGGRHRVDLTNERILSRQVQELIEVLGVYESYHRLSGQIEVSDDLEELLNGYRPIREADGRISFIRYPDDTPSDQALVHHHISSSDGMRMEVKMIIEDFFEGDSPLREKFGAPPDRYRTRPK